MSCDECPFLRTSDPGVLHGFERRPAEFLSFYAMGESAILCVKSFSCVGALVFLKNCAKLPRHPDLSRQVSLMTRDVEAYFGSVQEFCAHHLPGCEVRVVGHRVVYVRISPDLALEMTLVSNEDLRLASDEMSRLKDEVEALQDELDEYRSKVARRDSSHDAELARSRFQLHMASQEVKELRTLLARADARLRARSEVVLARFDTLEVEEETWW